MTISPFDLHTVHPSWRPYLEQGLANMNQTYLHTLCQSNDWLPGPEKIFSAFSLPLNQVNYVLFGESPYPRRESANGYAFWDAAVKDIWSPTGLSTKVNRATSLRHIVKMLLIAEGLLDQQSPGQPDIAAINKSPLVQTNNELFANFLRKGFLLLNATPVLAASPQKDAKAWGPFTKEILNCLIIERPQAIFILLGRIANTIESLTAPTKVNAIKAEHPYNHTFITNTGIINFFKNQHLLLKS